MELSKDEIAKHLGLPSATVERWVRQGKIPVQKKGINYSFSKSLLKKWATNHNLSFFIPQNPDIKSIVNKKPSLTQAIISGGVFYEIIGTDTESALQAAVEKIDTLPPDLKSELYEKLVERENIASTGIGKGIAVPHPREPLSRPPESSVIATCFLKEPVDFKAIDNKPVSVLFVLLCPSLHTHLHLLSRLSFCLRDDEFATFLRSTPEADVLIEKITEFEMKMDK